VKELTENYSSRFDDLRKAAIVVSTNKYGPSRDNFASHPDAH